MDMDFDEVVRDLDRTNRVLRELADELRDAGRETRHADAYRASNLEQAAAVLDVAASCAMTASVKLDVAVLGHFPESRRVDES
jgi:hypothetical protein